MPWRQRDTYLQGDPNSESVIRGRHCQMLHQYIAYWTNKISEGYWHVFRKHYDELRGSTLPRDVPELMKIIKKQGKPMDGSEFKLCDQFWKKNPIFNWHKHYPQYIHHKDHGKVFGDGQELECHQHFWRNASQKEVVEQLTRVIEYMNKVAGKYDMGRTLGELQDMAFGRFPYRGWDNGFCGAHGLMEDGGKYKWEVAYLYRSAVNHMEWNIVHYWAEHMNFNYLYSWRYWEIPEGEWMWGDEDDESHSQRLEGIHTARTEIHADVWFPKDWKYKPHHLYRKYEGQLEYDPLPTYTADEPPEYPSPPEYDSEDGFFTAEETESDSE